MADSKYETFLRRTRKRVQRPANDHDKAQIGAGQTALLDRMDDLRALKKRVTNAIRSRVEILETEERELRKLSKAKQKDVFCDALVLIDSRQGGVILVRDAETNEVLAGPTPLSASQREVFASTKSQPGLFGDPVAVNEDLAKKLNLMEYLADDPPITIEQRVANALDAGDLPEALKEEILALDEEDDPAPKAKKDKAPKESKKKSKKAKGEAFTNPTPPAPTPPPASATPVTAGAADDEPGPAAVEPDRDELPKHPPRARAPLSDTPEDEPSAGDVADAEGMAGDIGETHAPATESDDDALPDFDASEPDAAGDAAASETLPDASDDASDDAEESPRAREYDTRSTDAEEEIAEAEAAEMDAADDAPPDSADAHGEPVDDVDLSEMPEPSDVPPDAEIVTDDIPEMDGDDASTEPAGEPVAASSEAASPPVALPIVKPVEPEEEAAAKTAETPAPKKGRKKKGEVDPPNPDVTAEPAPPAAEPVAPVVPVASDTPAAPALSVANHFGLKTEKMANDAVAAFKSMAKRTVFFGRNLAADVETEAKTKFSATMRGAVVPVFEHLAAEKQITRRKLANGDVAYYDAPTIAKSAKDLTPDRVEAAIAAHLKK